MFRGLLVVAGCVMLLSVGGCAKREDRVVAEVAGEKIRVRDVEAAFSKLSSAELKEAMQTLQILIDRDLLIVEARSRGLGESQEIQEALKQAEVEKIRQVHRKRLAKGIVVSEEEMRGYFEENGLDAKTEVRASHIEVRTLEAAEEILKELEKGADFAALAREHSIDQVSAKKGGDLGYWQRGRMVGASARKIFSMKVGETSEPFQSKQGYHIIRIMDDRPVGFEAQKSKIEERIRRRKLKEKSRTYVEDLKEKAGFQVNEEVLALLLDAEITSNDSSSLADAQIDSLALLTFDEGAITLGQTISLVGRLSPGRRPALGDSAQVVQFAEQIALNTVLLPGAFREDGLYETEEVRSHLAAKKNERMVEELRRIEVDAVVFGKDATEKYYQEYVADFLEPKKIRVEALWTHTRTEARKAFRKIRAGADMEQLAGTLSSPSDRWENYDDYQFQCTDRDREWYGEIVGEAEKTKVGQLGGPVRVATARQGQPVIRYAVFRVLEKFPERQHTLEEPSVHRVIRKKLWGTKRIEIEQRFQTLLLELRERYADQIHVNEKNLKLVSFPEEEG